MPQTDDAIKVLADTLTKAVEAINKLIDTAAGDRTALEAAKSTIAQLEATATSVDAGTAQSLSGLTAMLNDLADKAIAATPGDSATPSV